MAFGTTGLEQRANMDPKGMSLPEGSGNDAGPSGCGIRHETPYRSRRVEFRRGVLRSGRSRGHGLRMGVILLVIEILHDLIYPNCKNYGGKYSIWYVLGDAGFISSTVEHALQAC